MSHNYRKFATDATRIASKLKYVPKSGTHPKGFVVGGTHSGVKKDGKSLDLCLLASTVKCNASAVFTKNAFQAAPVLISKQVLHRTNGQSVQGVVINSGCANAVTGQGGLDDARTMCEDASQVIKPLLLQAVPNALVMSTGVIGQRLSMDKIRPGISELSHRLGDSHTHWLQAANAICTTDTFPKLLSRQFEIDGVVHSISGIAKGAGMIHPNMATLLGVFATDANVPSDALDKALKFATEKSFNSISVDGDTSTNDTVAVFANGAANGPIIDCDSPFFGRFQQVLTDFATDLAKLVVRDGEGATKFITVTVEDASSESDAKTIAMSIARSSLFKTAMYGKDANWGRILCATGYAGVSVDPSKTCVQFVPSDHSSCLSLLVNGEPQNVDEARAAEILDKEDIEVRVDLGTGRGCRYQVYTCDLSHEYVTINGDYRS